MVRFTAFLLCVAMLMCTATAQIYYGTPPQNWQEESVLEWVIFDTNEGDAMLLRCNGEAMMVDGGPAPFREKLRLALEMRGLTEMKYILSTHAHDDHIDGLRYLFTSGFTAGEYLHPYTDVQVKKNDRLEKTVKAAKRSGAVVRRLRNGDKLTLGSADIQVFRCMQFDNENAKSLMLKVCYGNSSILLCADIIGQTQHWFYENLPPESLKADLIKMPHHDLTPAVPQFLETVDPMAAIVTNTYDKPSHNCRDQLVRANIPTFYSGEGGVHCVTNGNDWYIWQSIGSFDDPVGEIQQ